jgi:hypothetical protein
VLKKYLRAILEELEFQEKNEQLARDVMYSWKKFPNDFFGQRNGKKEERIPGLPSTRRSTLQLREIVCNISLRLGKNEARYVPPETDNNNITHTQKRP